MEIRYRLNHPIALDAHFTVDRLTVLLGPSGAGKTTLLKAIAGLIPAEGSPFGSLPPEQRPIGYMPQHFALFPHLSARENVEFPLAHLPRAERRARALDLLAQMGIAGLTDRRPRQLSGGEQQRVALARALARDPELLLLDEPMSALDLPTREDLTDGLVELVETVGVPALVVTHDASLARVSHRVAAMIGGRVLQQGPPDEVFARPEHSTVARLVGFRNLFPGTIREVRSPWLWMDSPLGTIQAPAPPWAAPGGTVMWGVRPGCLRELASGAGSRISGQVVSVQRDGRARVRVNDTVLIAQAPDATPGDSMELFIPASAVHVMGA